MVNIRVRLSPFVTLIVCLANSMAFAAESPTLSSVLSKKMMTCGVSGNLPGFSSLDSKAEMLGIDADFCRAVAAAVGIGVQFKSLDAVTRFTALQTGEVDLLARNTTVSMSRDTKLGFNFVGVNYYDGQGFIALKSSNLKSALGLNGSTVCVQSGTTTELNLNDFAKRNKLKIKPILFEKFEDANKAYAAGRCDAYTTDASGLAAVRSGLKDPSLHVILKDVISKEPLGPLVRENDPKWENIVRWALNGLITAEEKSITKANVTGQKDSADPEIRRLLGYSGTLGSDAGLPNDWAVKMISAVGNYGEIFERNLGPKTPLKLERGLNRLWNQGGLLYSPPFN